MVTGKIRAPSHPDPRPILPSRWRRRLPTRGRGYLDHVRSELNTVRCLKQNVVALHPATTRDHIHTLSTELKRLILILPDQPSQGVIIPMPGCLAVRCISHHHVCAVCFSKVANTRILVMPTLKVLLKVRHLCRCRFVEFATFV